MSGRFNVVDYFNRRFRDKNVEVLGNYSVIQEDSAAIISERLFGKHPRLSRKLATLNL